MNKHQQNLRDSNNLGGGAEAESHTHLEAMRSGDRGAESGLRSSAQNDESAVDFSGWWEGAGGRRGGEGEGG